MGASARTEGSATGPLPFPRGRLPAPPASGTAPGHGQRPTSSRAGEGLVSPERMPPLRTCLPAAWIELLDVFAGLTRFADDPVSVCLDDQILDFRRVMQG